MLQKDGSPHNKSHEMTNIKNVPKTPVTDQVCLELEMAIQSEFDLSPT